MIVLGSPSFTAGDMPIDTLFQLGTSPPVYSFLSSFKQLSLNRTGCGMPNSVSSNGNPLKPCLRILDRSSMMAPDIRVIDLPDKVEKGPTRLRVSEQSDMDSEAPARCRNIIKKRVCFANPLTNVRIMDGPSDTPPRLDINLYKDVIQDEEAKPSPPYTYVPDFEQPASNYLDFRERLERNKVCLENLVIKDNISIMGTTKVQNLSFEKSLKVRVTFDEWKTFRDIPATYVFPDCQSSEDAAAAPSTSDRYDTFKFQFELPPNLGGKPTMFCICYECNQTSYWDNNKGANYRIISLQEKESSEHDRLLEHYTSLSSDYPWAEVAFHSLADKERPYW